MPRLFAILITISVALAACAPQQAVTIGSDGRALPKIYRISRSDTDKIQFRMLDAVNALRGASSQPLLAFNSQLNAAAATHSRDMSVQNRPWHFGSDGSSPTERVQRAGYTGKLLGENISETYESELETLGAWIDQPDTRRVILTPDATHLGFAWFQEKNGKIWWTLITGRNAAFPDPV